MTSKKLLSALMALVFALSLFTALPVSAANGTVTVTVGGATIASGGTIPAKSTLVITLPYALTSEQVVTNVVLSESTKTTTVTWNAREFDGYTLNGDQLTIPFALGDLAMNGDYKFTFTDPAGAGAAVEFAFKTSASDGYVMYDNFSRYPVGEMVASATTHYPFYTYAAGFDDGGNKYPAEIKAGTDGTKYMRLNNSTRYNSETVVSYRTAFSAPVTATSFKGVTEVEFSMLDERTTMYEIGGIIFKVIDDTTVDVYARTTHEAWNSSYSQNSAKWTLLERVTFASKEEKDGKHNLKYITTHYTNQNDKRTLYKVLLDDVEVGVEVLGAEGLAMGSGNHSVLHQGVLLSNGGTFKNAYSVTFDIMNANGSGATVAPYMDIYSIGYYEYVAPPVTLESASAASGSTISPVGTLSYTFSDPIVSSSLDSGLIFEEKDKRDIAGTTVSGNEVPLWQTRLCNYSVSADGKTVTIAFEEGDLAANSEYRVRLTTAVESAESALAAEQVFEYKTSQYQNYYLNENFNRFPVQQYSYGYAAVSASKPWTGLMMPFAKFYGNASTWVWGQHVIENDNGKALQLKMVAGYTGAYGYMGLRNDYSPEIPEGVSEHNGTYEFEFDVQGTSTTVFEVGDFVLGNLGGEEGYSLMVRTGGAITGVLGDGLARVASFTAPTATPAKYTLKYEITLDRNDGGVKRVRKAWLNGNEISLPVGGIAINLNNEANQMADSLNFAGKTKDYTRMFGIGDVTTTSNDALPILNIYSIKYYATGLNAVITETATGSVSITMTNDGAAPVDVVPVLAVYNGDVLVGFDGLNAAATTVAVETPATITRTVANAVSGNTYKVMLLNSKTALQPLMTVYQGVIE